LSTESSPRYRAERVTQYPLIHQGKVRDSFAIDDQHMLIVASDRLSAFDVVMNEPIPGKGEILTRIANFWFERTQQIIPNHLSGIAVEDVIDEAIIRGYIIGSGWKDYLETGAVCGIPLPAGLQQAEKLPEVIFTPSNKAAAGQHDVNIDFETVRQLVGDSLAEQVREASIRLYQYAVKHAAARGIIIADTKFEFGLDGDGRLRVMDEVLTPDSSRFWPRESYRTGISPPSYDKQFVRDYLETLEWDKTPPPPPVPDEIIAATAEKYREAFERITGPEHSYAQD